MNYICLSLVLVLPHTTNAELTGEIIFRHPDNVNELWITDLTDTDNARLLYKQTHPIRDFAVQENGNYIATIVQYNDPNKPNDIFLIDTHKINHKERMLTHLRFHKILDVELSRNADILYTNFLPIITALENKHDKFGRRTSGIYLITNKDIEDPNLPPPQPVIQREVLSPPVSLLKGVTAQNVALSHNGKLVAYDTPEGVQLINLETGQDFRVSIEGSMPIFSPDGKKLAVLHRRLGLLGFSYDLYIFSVESLLLLNVIKGFNNHIEFLDMKWSPDGEYIVYTTYGGSFINRNTSYQHYTIPYTGGESIEILDGMFENGVPKFDWTSAESVYPVEPKNRLTTLWGKVKQ